MDNDTKKVAVLVDNLFEQSEFVEPIKAIQEAGMDAVGVSPIGRHLQAMKHNRPGDRFLADVNIDDVAAEDFDGLVLPGGALNADNLRTIDKARQWVQYFVKSGKPVAVICHAPWVLISAGLVKGKRLTSYHTIQDDIRNAGGEWIDAQVVIDGNLITSRRPDDLPLFNEALVIMLNPVAA